MSLPARNLAQSYSDRRTKAQAVASVPQAYTRGEILPISPGQLSNLTDATRLERKYPFRNYTRATFRKPKIEKLHK
ncbi:MAG: hypothetical protein DMG89_24125 [Acidobacteria bacterium]|nr:MAG: hypothetical protein DMG89_24125 [Acidobacteriota bacterium]